MSPKLKKLLIILGAILGVLGITVLIGALTGWFGLIGPVDEIAIATKNTLTAESFTVKVQLEELGQSALCRVVIDNQNKDLTLCMEWGETDILAIYKGCCILYCDGQYSCYDCKPQIAAFFNTKQRVEELIRDVSGKKPDYESAVNKAVYNENVHGIIEEQVDFSALPDALKAVRKQLNNRKWLKEQFDFTADTDNGTKTYSFHVSDLGFLDDLLPLAEPAFANRLAYNYVVDELHKISFDGELDILFGIRDKQLRHLEIRGMVIMEFTDIGTTTVDRVKLQQLLDCALAQ